MVHDFRYALCIIVHQCINSNQSSSFSGPKHLRSIASMEMLILRRALQVLSLHLYLSGMTMRERSGKRSRCVVQICFNSALWGARDAFCWRLLEMLADRYHFYFYLCKIKGQFLLFWYSQLNDASNNSTDMFFCVFCRFLLQASANGSTVAGILWCPGAETCRRQDESRERTFDSALHQGLESRQNCLSGMLITDIRDIRLKLEMRSKTW